LRSDPDLLFDAEGAVLMADGTDFAQIRGRSVEPLEDPEWSEIGRPAPNLATLMLWLVMGAGLGVFWREMFGLAARLFA
jgi:hypothetical protein